MKYREYWQKLLSKLGLGLQKPSALGLRAFGGEGYCWEDWKRDTQKQYPLKYWLGESLPRFFGSWWYQWEMKFYQIKSRYWTREHLLDLRQADCYVRTEDQYDGGYLDYDGQIVRANFLIFDKFMRHNQKLGYLDFWKQEIDNPSEDSDSTWREHYRAWLDLWSYWTVERNQKNQEYSDLLLEISDLEKPERRQRYPELRELQAQMTARETEMLLILIRHREGMWI